MVQWVMYRILWRIQTIGVALWLFLAAPVEAATVPSGFNTAIVPVASRSAADLHPALVKALTQVLIKITGNSRIGLVPAVQQQFPAVEKFIQKYNYLDSNLQVTFDQRALITLLAQAQQPVWLSARPLTLIWLSVNGQPPVAPASDALVSAAAARAIPITFPTTAPTDSAAIDPPALAKIAAQYQAPAGLYGELTQTEADAAATVNWLLVWRGQTWQWRDEGAQPAVLQAGVDKLADIMGGALAVSLDPQAGNNIWLAVMGINNLTDYHAALHALKQCQPVLGVFVQDVGSHGVLLLVTTIGEGAGALKEALAATQHFTPAAATPATPDVLNYQWRP